MNKKMVVENVDRFSVFDFDCESLDDVISNLQQLYAKHGGVLKLGVGYNPYEEESYFHVFREREETDVEYHQRISAEDLRKNQETKKMLDWVEQNQDTVKWKLEQLAGSAK